MLHGKINRLRALSKVILEALFLYVIGNDANTFFFPDKGFLCVIKTLQKEGFFETLDGGRTTENEAFAAFGIAVNEGLNDFSAQFSANRKDNSPETRAVVFDQLKKIYLKYEKNIEDKRIGKYSSNNSRSSFNLNFTFSVKKLRNVDFFYYLCTEI